MIPWMRTTLEQVAVGARDGFATFREFERRLVADTSALDDEADAAAVFLMTIFPRLWAESGLARVEMPHRLCASLCATKMPPEFSVAELAPWPTHVIDVPTGIIPMVRDGFVRAGTGEWVRAVFVHAQDDAWRWIAFTDTDKGRVEITGTDARGLLNLDEEAMAATRVVKGDTEKWAVPTPMARMCCTIGRLIVGTWLRIHAMRSESGAALGPPRAFDRKRGLPKAWTMRLVGDVRLDVREAVAAYVRGGGASPVVQSLVRGHWKRQACGAGGAERKWVHIEPYWRGPEDGPIAVRSHLIAGGAS